MCVCATLALHFVSRFVLFRKQIPFLCAPANKIIIIIISSSTNRAKFQLFLNVKREKNWLNLSIVFECVCMQQYRDSCGTSNSRHVCFCCGTLPFVLLYTVNLIINTCPRARHAKAFWEYHLPFAFIYHSNYYLLYVKQNKTKKHPLCTYQQPSIYKVTYIWARSIITSAVKSYY